MRVFISSVTYALKDERAALAAVLRVVPPYEPLLFEDFVAQDRSAREACLAGVEASDVYVLLLGPRYGEPLPDSGLAPTEEEFTAARRLGRPVLAFTKRTDEPDEPRQAAFKARVEDYVGGRFRASFSDPQTLNLAVLGALKERGAASGPLRWEQLPDPLEVRWRRDTPQLRDPRLHAPVLEVHLLPVPARPVSASRLQALPSTLARSAREVGFLAEGDPLESGNTSSAAWVWVPVGQGGGPWSGRRDHGYRGLAVHATGEVVAFEALPSDFLGALVERADLQGRSARLLVEAARHLDDDAGLVAVAAALEPLDQVFEGDPADVGRRSSGGLRTRQGLVGAFPASAAVRADALAGHVGDAAAEIAATLIQAVRDAPR